MNRRFYVYVTKYALANGIQRREVRDCFDISPDMVEDCEYTQCYYHGDDWHHTLPEAQAKAESMRQKKIASLRKQIAKLEKLTFEEVPDV
jgi:hypothetical protein